MLRRHILQIVRDSLQHFPAVLLVGARQAGKSTLAKQLVQDEFFDSYFTLDDLFTYRRIKENPEDFLDQTSGRVVIDEVQRVPELLIAVKKRIDDQPGNGRFLLTGSANVLSHPSVLESLAGRADIITLEGLSLSELLENNEPSPLLTDLFSSESLSVNLERWQKLDLTNHSKESLSHRIFYGSFPRIALDPDEHFAERWFAAYLKAYVERDVRDISRILDVVAFSKLFRLAGLMTSNLLNVKNLANETGIDQRTAARYLEIMELTFQGNLLRPWFNNKGKLLIKSPKVYLNDSGMACFLFSIQSPDELINHPKVGAIVETWIWSELRKLCSYSTNMSPGFYRTHVGKEVDFVFNRGNRTVAIESKWTNHPQPKDFAGLLNIQAVLGEEMKGVVLYPGQKIIPFGKNLAAVPMGILSGY